MTIRYENRKEAGQLLASELMSYAGRADVTVLALPRGGVPVAMEVADALNAPLDVFVVRKLGVPGHRELAMGAIATGGVLVINEEIVRFLKIPSEAIRAIAEEERRELSRREYAYRGDRPSPKLEDRIVILVDDGMATGSTMRAAISAVREQDPAMIIVAVPVAAASTCEELRLEVDLVVCPMMPEAFSAVGAWYDDFSPTTDEEVRDLLDRVPHHHGWGVTR
ncbi:MAG: phosphoribosyltransferase [Acidobacteria bacterium]|nr:phosphoribosyltransferase [Acidobacteriota bacterium]